MMHSVQSKPCIRPRPWRTNLLARSAIANFLVWTVIFFISQALMASSPADKSKSILVLETAVKSPDLPVSHDWSRDGRRVAIMFWQNAAIHMVDADGGKMVGPIVQEAPSLQLKLSPNTNFLVVTASRVARLYQVEPFRIVSSAAAPVSGCIFPNAKNVIFADDNTSVWVRCAHKYTAEEGARTRSAALRYSLPNLVLAETLTVPDLSPMAWEQSGSFETTANGGVSIGLAFSKERASGSIRGSTSYVVHCYWLASKETCFDDLKLDNKLPGRPGQLRVSWDLSLVAVGSDSREGQRIDIYETKAGQKVNSVGELNEYGILRHLEISRNGKYVIAGFSASKEGEGAIVVWDLASRKVQQTITRGAVEQMSMAPDGRKLVAMTRDEISLYRIDE